MSSFIHYTKHFIDGYTHAVMCVLEHFMYWNTSLDHSIVPPLITTLYPIGRPVRATITLYPIGRYVRATIILYPIGGPVRATITLYPIGRYVRATIIHCIL